MATGMRNGYLLLNMTYILIYSMSMGGNPGYGKNLTVGQYRFIHKPQTGYSLAPLIFPDHSAIFYHYKKQQFIDSLPDVEGAEARNDIARKQTFTDFALGMLRDKFGLQLLIEEKVVHLERQEQSLYAQEKKMGGSLTYYFPGHFYNHIGLWAFFNLGIHLQLSFGQFLVTGNNGGQRDNDLDFYTSSGILRENLLTGKLGINAAMQITPHFGVKPWVVLNASEEMSYIWDERYIPQLLKSGDFTQVNTDSLTKAQGELRYGLSLYFKAPLVILPINFILSIDPQKNVMLGISVFDYNSYGFNDPKYYVGSNSKFLRQVKEKR